MRRRCEDLENGATGLVLVFAGSVSANGFGLDADTGRAAARARRHRSRRRHRDRLDLSARRRATWSRDLAALIEAPRHRAGRGRSARQHQSDRRLCREPDGAPQAGTTWRAAFAAMIGGLCRGRFSRTRSRSPTDASSTMPAARKRRSLPSRSPARSPICARSKPRGMALDAARDAIYFRLAADADQFLTIAKFRAARKLWARVEAACGLAPKPADGRRRRPRGA